MNTSNVRDYLLLLDEKRRYRAANNQSAEEEVLCRMDDIWEKLTVEELEFLKERSK